MFSSFTAADCYTWLAKQPVSSPKMMRTSSFTLISLPQGNEILDFLVLSAIITASLSLIIQGYLSYLDIGVKWIKKEAAALYALLMDLDQLLEEEKIVESQARHFWDSELKLEGIHLQLSESARQWVDAAKKLAHDANGCITYFEKQRESRGLIYLLPTELFRIVSIHDVICQIYHVKSAILDLLEQKERDAKDIYEIMESSRSKNRSLLNQYTIQEDMKSVPAEDQKKTESKSRTSIQGVMTTNEHLISGMEERWSIHMMLPLHALLKDLSQIQLETETEKTWKGEAEKLVEEAEDRIDNFSWWVSTFGWISLLAPILKVRFKWHMKRICTEFDRLLKRKAIYRFKFIDRAAEKSIRQSTSTYHNTHDVKAITLAVSNTRSELRKEEGSSKKVNEINSLCDSLEKMCNKLHGREDAAGSKACLVQIKYIAQEVEKSLGSYLTEPEPKNFEQIKQATTLLQSIIDASYIERQESIKVFGLENDIRKLVNRLITNGDKDSVVSIFGMMGIGKTTLAKAIYYNKTVVKRFPIRIWVTATQKESTFEAQVLERKDDGMKAQILSLKKVRHLLKEKDGLVIVDDISTTKGWDEVKAELVGITQGIRMVLTTRSRNLALHADTSSKPYQLPLRTKEESWKLFRKVTLNPKLDPAEEKLARKVVGRCGGLPLAILSLGCLMSANGVTQEQLKWAHERINKGQNQTPWLDAGEYIYQGLDETLKNCLSYFTLFPGDFEIPARRLINLWVAEGLVKQDESFGDKKRTLEDVAEEYLQELKDCNMIQAVELKSNRKIKTCRLHRLLREPILKYSNRTNSSQCQSLSRHVQRRFAYHFDDHDAILGVDANLANVLSREMNPLSIIFFDTREGNKPGERIGNILSIGIASGHFKEIKVLDLERVFKPQLPQIIRKLIHLKYLGLRWTCLEEIPPFIGELLNLETLDVKHTCIRTLPTSIMRLKKLRNLYLNQRYRSKLEGKLRGNLLEKLQILWGVFIDETSPLLHGLHRLKNLRKLKLAFQLNEEKQDALAKLIGQLNQLHSLRLKSLDEMGSEPQLITLNNMSRLENLSSMELFGKLQDPLKASRLPPNLTHLTLSASNLSDKSMPVLQKLTKLISLCLYAESYTGKSLICTEGSFPQLRVFRLWKLEKLEKWKIEEVAMPRLVELEIRSCSNLEFPDELKHLKTLQKIQLQGMSEKFMTGIEKNKRTFWDDIEIVYD